MLSVPANRHIALVFIFGLLIWVALLTPGTSLAHPMGNFSINHYTKIIVAPRVIELDYIIDMAEIPTFQEIQRSEIVPKADDPSLAPYLTRQAEALKGGLSLTAGGRTLQLESISRQAIFPPGAGGLPTMKIGFVYHADLPTGQLSSPVALHYQDNNFPGRAGWKEVIAAGLGGVHLASSSVPERDRSAQLSNYPVDLLNSPPQVLEAYLRPVMIAAATGPGSAAMGEARLPLRANRIATPRNPFTELMTIRQPGTWFLLTAALIAIALGALHALEPGHGKTVVAAYLVGSRGTAGHAVMLAATVTASHTAGVYVLGALTLYASRWMIPERIYPWLGGVSGLIIAVLGVWLFLRRLAAAVVSPLPHFSVAEGEGEGAGTLQAQPPPDHSHDHSHPHDHDHTRAHSHDQHDSHDHAHQHFHPHRHDIFGRHVPGDGRADGKGLSTRGLLALGVSGGIVPCPAALVVLLSALSLNRAAFGLFLIVAFSAGLAGVLVCFGLGVVYARRFVAQRLNLEGGAPLRWLPLVSSVVITVAGVAITFQALASGGIISGWR